MVVKSDCRLIIKADYQVFKVPEQSSEGSVHTAPSLKQVVLDTAPRYLDVAIIGGGITVSL